jgi:c-di-GMP-binding flagellar brake protein YcgR
MVDFTISPPVNDPILAEWLLKLNNKLDTIINLLSPETKGFLQINFMIMNISGNGIRFVSKDRYKTGDCLEVKMVLYQYPFHTLYLYGNVVRVDRTDNDEYSVAIEFADLDEDVKKELVNFDFKKHRETLKRILESKNFDNLIMLK